MAGYNHFDYVPSSTSNNRSVFKFHKPVATSGEIGHLYPMCKPVRMLPGSSLKLDFSCEIRSGAMIAPLMDELYMDIFAFNVPNRIVWEHWKQFLGSVDDVLFDNLTEYTIPHFKYCGIDVGIAGNIKEHVWNHMLANYFELPYLDYTQQGEGETNVENIEISALPFRGYVFIWNEYFRPEQLVNPILFGKTDAGYAGDNLKCTPMGITWNGTVNGYYMILPYSNSSDDAISGGAVLPTFRVHKSLWTACLPKPSLETLNLLGDLKAPVGYVAPVSGTYTAQQYAGQATGTAIVDGQFTKITTTQTAGISQASGIDIIADLSQAVLTLNNYLETRMLQNYYNLLNRAGSRYDEIIRNLFHTVSPAAIIDIPELIVHKRFTIYRKQVVSQGSTNFGESSVQMLGQQAGYIDSVVSDSFFTKSTTEHSYIHLLWTIRPAMIRMANGIEPEWTQLAKFDQYYSCFDGMGDVGRKKSEIYVPNNTATPDMASIFGYQEYGAEYKYQRASATGQLGPYVSGNLSYFTLTEKLSAQPVLVTVNAAGFGSYVSCIVEAEAFARVLAISNPMVAQPFVLDIRLDGEVVHPMPVYNIPGQGELL